MSSELDDIALDATVHILGASLSSFDVVNRLFAPETGSSFTPGSDGRLVFEPGENQRRVVLCSRSGRLKAAQSRTPMSLKRRHFTAVELRKAAASGGTTLDTVANIVRAEAHAHRADVDWKAVAQPYAGCSSSSEVNARAQTLLESAIHAAKCGGTDNLLVDLSRLLFPIENMPRGIQYVTYAIPVRYYAEILRGVFLRGSTLEVLWPQALVLLVMGVSILIIAAQRFRKRLD